MISVASIRLLITPQSFAPARYVFVSQNHRLHAYAMISTLLVDPNHDFSELLQAQLSAYCPQIELTGIARSVEEASQMIEEEEPELIFIDLTIAVTEKARNLVFDHPDTDFETVFLSSNPVLHQDEEQFKKAGYLGKPISVCGLIFAIQQVQTQIKIKKAHTKEREILHELLRFTPPHDVISIPTIEGIEFLKVHEIIRCEGLQKYTRIVTEEKTDIISSYSIGHFCKLLQSDGFFPTHKSHLINLRHIKKFMPEGTVILRDGSAVPVSRRRKVAFLDRIGLFQESRLS
jgi:two-component system LytT family response regulator